MQYEPKEYWNERGKSFLKGLYFITSLDRLMNHFLYKPILKHLLIKEINRIKPRTLLGVGCGPGRLFNLYKKIIEVHCVDFIPIMLKRAKGLIKQRKYKNSNLCEMEAQNLGFMEESLNE